MKQQALALVFVAMLAAASVAPASAATNPTTVESMSGASFSLASADFQNASEWTHKSNVTGFEANESKAAFLNQTTTSNDPGVRLIDNETGETVKTWGNASLTETFANASTSTYAYRLNVTHGDLSGVDIQAGETKNVTFRYVDNTSVSAENETYTNVTVEFTAADTYSNFRVSDHMISTTDLVTFETDGWNGYFEDKMTEFQAEDVAINGTNSTISVDMVNSSARSRLSSSLESVTESNWDKATLITVWTSDDEKVLVKGYTTLPDDLDKTETYAKIDESSNSITINLGEEFEGDTTVSEVKVKTNVGAIPQFTRGMDLWVQNFEWSFAHFNPLTVVPSVDGFDFSFDASGIASLATVIPMAASRRKLA